MPCVGCTNSSQWAQVIYFAGFIVIFQFGWAAVQVSHLSLIPVLAHDERSRTELTALRYEFTMFFFFTFTAHAIESIFYNERFLKIYLRER